MSNPLDHLEPDPQRSMPEDDFLAAAAARLEHTTQQHRAPQEDSGNEPAIDIPEQPAAWSRRWLEDIRSRPMSDERTIDVAAAFAAIEAAEQQARTAAALERVAASLERLGEFAGSLSESMAAAVGTPTPIRHESPAQSRTERPGAHSEETPQ